jgi:hypothetical protein
LGENSPHLVTLSADNTFTVEERKKIPLEATFLPEPISRVARWFFSKQKSQKG